MASPTLQTLSSDLATVAEAVGPSVVAVQSQHRLPSSGIQWRKDVIVTVSHGVRSNSDISVLLGPEKSVGATLAGRDPSTDLAILKLSGEGRLPQPELADTSNPRLANLVLALGRSWRGTLVSSFRIVGGLSGEWQTWYGDKIDRHIRLDLQLYSGLSGGPLLDDRGKAVGINTCGWRAAERLPFPQALWIAWLMSCFKRATISRPYLGLGMQPVAVPESLRSKLKPELTGGLIVVHVKPSGPADRAGILLGKSLSNYKASRSTG